MLLLSISNAIEKIEAVIMFCFSVSG